VKKWARGRPRRSLRQTPRCILFLRFRPCPRHHRLPRRADRMLRQFPTRRLRRPQLLQAPRFLRALTGSPASLASRAAPTLGRWPQISPHKARRFLSRAYRVHLFPAFRNWRPRNRVCRRLSLFWVQFLRRIPLCLPPLRRSRLLVF
jgi:hypothetical protein